VGDADSFGLREGESISLDNTFCRLLMAERPPNLIPDTKNDARVKDLEVTGAAGIGSTWVSLSGSQMAVSTARYAP
jgi:hypothetical protein